MDILLIGEKNSKRTIFFEKAAQELSVDFRFVSYADSFEVFEATSKNHTEPIFANCAIKLDPPSSHGVFIDEINSFRREYSSFLSKIATAKTAKFLNSPQAIMAVLDKLECKRVLEAAKLRTADFFDNIADFSALKMLMSEKRLNSVFIKPRYGSGAAGIMAYRRAGKNEVAYTTIVCSSNFRKPSSHDSRELPLEGRLCNSKRTRRITSPNEIESIINALLKTDALVEKWIPKASINGNPYDIRVVWQFGKIEYAVARLAKGSISNLHLGGSVMDINELRLSSHTLYEIENLCSKAMQLFPELQSAGIDILLESSTLNPYIIEINGQGDLLYADIYDKNKIYKSQLMYLKNL